MSNENLDHTETTEEQVEEQEASTTEETVETDSVEDFSEKLDKAETDEEAIAAFKGVDLDEDTPEDIETAVDDTDTEPESTPYIFDLKDGDIELSLNLGDEKEMKQARMLMQQGLNYAGKTTELAKHRSFVNYAEEHGISLEDIQTMAAAKGGDKNAIASISKSAEVDVFDLDNDMAQEYAPEPVQLQQQVDPRLDTIANEILSNEEHKSAFQKWFPTMPETVQNEVMGNAQVLEGVQQDIDAGVFAPAMEQAYKYQRINGMDFGTAYTRAKEEYMILNQPEPIPEITRDDRSRASAPRSGGSPATRNSGYGTGVISDMSDDEFLKNYNDIVSSVQANR